jgi:hypothetical protein
MDQVSYNITEYAIAVLISWFISNRLKIAKHQRQSKVWPILYKQRFIDSIKKEHPCPLILIYEDESGQKWLEDGLQRISTINSFMNDEFSEEETKTKYSEWNDDVKDLFKKHKLPVLLYSNANQMTRVMIFDRFQNGSPLREGERLNSLGYTVLVSTTRNLLLADKNEDGSIVYGRYYNRLCNVLGELKYGNDDNRYTQLLDMTALMNGMAHGFVDKPGISKKYKDLRATIFDVIDENKVCEIIEKLLTILENARCIEPIQDKKTLSMLRNPGNFLAPIVYSLVMNPKDKWNEVSTKWTNIIINFSRDSKVLTDETTGLLKDVSSARSWNNNRWINICKNANISLPENYQPASNDEDEDISDE